MKLVECLRYLVQKKRYCWFIRDLSLYLDGLYDEEREGGDIIEFLFDVCGRVDGGGVGMVKGLCRWLNGGVILNCEGKVDKDGNVLSGNDIRDSGVKCLSCVVEGVCGKNVSLMYGLLMPLSTRMKGAGCVEEEKKKKGSMNGRGDGESVWMLYQKKMQLRH